MLATLNKYRHVFLIGQQSNIVYRWNFALRGFFSLFHLAVVFTLWTATYDGATEIGGFDVRQTMTYFVMLLVIHYSILVIMVSLSFGITSTQGFERSYFTLFEFSRLPRSTFRGIFRILFVWAFPAVIVSNIPSQILLRGFQLTDALWPLGVILIWFGLAIFVFHRGLRRYSSASS